VLSSFSLGRVSSATGRQRDSSRREKGCSFLEAGKGEVAQQKRKDFGALRKNDLLKKKKKERPSQPCAREERRKAEKRKKGNFHEKAQRPREKKLKNEAENTATPGKYDPVKRKEGTSFLENDNLILPVKAPFLG